MKEDHHGPQRILWFTSDDRYNVPPARPTGLKGKRLDCINDASSNGRSHADAVAWANRFAC